MQFKESRTLTLAGLQTAPVPQDPAATWSAFATSVQNARSLFDELNMVVAPELHLSAPPGLLIEPAEYAVAVAVEIPGPLTEGLCELARDTAMWLVPGTVSERAADGIANSAVGISLQGGLSAPYRKCFPWQS